MNGFAKDFFSAIYNMFRDVDGTFSWKKGLTAIAGFVFAAVSLGYAFTSWVRVLPMEYTTILAGVFGAHFVNTWINGKKVTLSEPTQ